MKGTGGVDCLTVLGLIRKLMVIFTQVISKMVLSMDRDCKPMETVTHTRDNLLMGYLKGSGNTTGKMGRLFEGISSKVKEMVMGFGREVRVHYRVIRVTMLWI